MTRTNVFILLVLRLAARGGGEGRHKRSATISIATAAGAVPPMIAAGAAARGTIGTTIVFSIVFGIVSDLSMATVTTWFLIPLLHSRLALFTGSPLAVTRRLEARIAGGPRPAAAAE